MIPLWIFFPNQPDQPFTVVAGVKPILYIKDNYMYSRYCFDSLLFLGSLGVNRLVINAQVVPQISIHGKFPCSMFIVYK